MAFLSRDYFRNLRTELDTLTLFFIFSVLIFFIVFLVIPIVSIIGAAFIIDGNFSFDFFVAVFKNPIYFDLEIGSFVYLVAFILSLIFISRLLEKFTNDKPIILDTIMAIFVLGFILFFSFALDNLIMFVGGIIVTCGFILLGSLANQIKKRPFNEYFLVKGTKNAAILILLLLGIAFLLWAVISAIIQILEMYDTFGNLEIITISIIITLIVGILFSFFTVKSQYKDIASFNFQKAFIWNIGVIFITILPFFVLNFDRIASGWDVNFYERVADPYYGYVIKISGINASVLINTIFVAISTTLLSAGFGVFFAFIIARYEFSGKSLLRYILLVPLVIPPFVGAIGIKRMLAHPQGYSFFNRLLYDAIPLLNYPIIFQGLTTVILVQSVHFYTLVYLNSLSAFQNIDPTLEESAENLGATGGKLFRSVTFPLAIPGIAAGSILTFILSIEDLGTPLIFSGDPEIEALLTTVVYRKWLDQTGTLQGDGLALAVILFFLAMTGFTIIRRYVGVREYAMVSKGGTFNPRTRTIRWWTKLGIWACTFFLMIFALMPHIGTFLLSVSDNFTWTPTNPDHLFPTAISFKLLGPDIGDMIRVISIPLFWIVCWLTVYIAYKLFKKPLKLPTADSNPELYNIVLLATIFVPMLSVVILPDNIINIGIGTLTTDIIGLVGEILNIDLLYYIGQVGGFSDVINRTTIYAMIAVILIIIFGIAAAYVLARKNFPGKYWFDTLVTSPIAIPGIIIGFGLFTAYIPLLVKIFGSTVQYEPIFTGFYMVHFLLIGSFTVRRFPFTVRAAYAGLQQTHVTFEEASKNLGASNLQTILKITIPLIGVSVLAGAMISFVYALGEVSTSLILLGTEAQATIPYMIYDKNKDPLPVDGILGMNQAAALGMLLVVLQVVIISFSNRVLKQRGSALTGI